MRAVRLNCPAFVYATSVTALCCLVLFFASARPLRAQELSKSDLEWFATLGFPDLSKSKLVNVATGGAWSQGGGPMRKSYRPGFLLANDGKKFTVFALDLCTQSYEVSAAGEPELQRVGYEEFNLRMSVENYLKSLLLPDNAEDYQQFLGQSLSDPLELFVLAHACYRQGCVEQAEKLLSQVHRQFARSTGGRLAKSLHQLLADEIAKQLMFRADRGFSDTSVSREDLLAQFERILKLFPEGEHPPGYKFEPVFRWNTGSHEFMARYYVRRLKKMVAEDEEKARKPARPQKELSKKECIAELIFRLRDQTGQQWSIPGSCDIFLPLLGETKEGNTPAQALAKFGYDAVPQLIEALDDERFCRASECDRWSWRVLCVGDCARQIIERISGRSFGSNYAESPAKLTIELAETKKKIESWWAEFQKKGEKQMLIEATQSGDWHSTRAAEMLQERYPEATLEAIAKGVTAAEDDWTVQSLIRTAAKLKGAATLGFLKDQMKAKRLIARVAAARELWERADPNAVPAMIAEWQSLKVTSGRHSWNDGPRELISFLAHCDRPEAVRALGKDLIQRDRDTRLNVIEEVARLTEDPSPATGGRKLSPEVIAARDELLMRALDDTERYWGMSSGRNGKGIHNPRLCDLAAWEVANTWKMPDAFDISASLRIRDRQRIELQNVWRKKQGMKLLAVSEAKKIDRLPDAAIQPLLQALLYAPNDAQRQQARQLIEVAGLPALPAAKELLAKISKDHPAFAELQKAVNRLACVVGEVKLGKDSAEPSKEFKEKMEALKDRPLEMRELIDLYVSVVKALPPGVSGVDISMEREGDDTGIVMEITLVKGKVAGPVLGLWWKHDEWINTDGQGTHGVLGHCNNDLAVSGDTLDEYTRSLQREFDRGPEKSILARSCLYREK
jgi:hypothetical protein